MPIPRRTWTISRDEAEVSESQDRGARFVAGSALLQELHDGAPSGHFTLEWLMSRLCKQSYAAIIFLMATIAMVPGFRRRPLKRARSLPSFRSGMAAR